MSLQANMELGVCGDGCDHDPADCYNKGYCYYEHLQEEAQKYKYICPLCGAEMDETCHGRQYCEDCNQKLNRKE